MAIHLLVNMKTKSCCQRKGRQLPLDEHYWLAVQINKTWMLRSDFYYTVLKCFWCCGFVSWSCGTTLLCDNIVSQLHTTHSEYFLIDIYN